MKPRNQDVDLVHPDFTWEGKSMDAPTLLARMELDKQDTRPWVRARAHWVSSWLKPDTLLEVKTSGTTGAPKTLFFTKNQAYQSALATGRFLGLGPGTRAFMALSCDYVAGKMMWVRALTLGWTVTEVDPGAAPWTETSGTFDFAALVPLQLALSMAQLDRFKQVLVGGAPLGAPLTADFFHRRLSTEVWVSFGMAETLTHFALAALKEATEQLSYQPLPGVRLSQNKQGCLVVDYPMLDINQLETNDVVEFKDDGSFIWQGRVDHVINSAGIKIHPESVGQVIGPLIDGPFDLGGMADQKWGVALCLATEKPQTPNFLRLLAESGLLRPHEVPKYLWVTQLPKTPSGKVKSRKLWADIAQGNCGEPVEKKD
jgi:O-succinylbenzoic acid--CoA ligase